MGMASSKTSIDKKRDGVTQYVYVYLILKEIQAHRSRKVSMVAMLQNLNQGSKLRNNCQQNGFPILGLLDKNNGGFTRYGYLVTVEEIHAL